MHLASPLIEGESPLVLYPYRPNPGRQARCGSSAVILYTKTYLVRTGSWHICSGILASLCRYLQAAGCRSADDPAI